MMADLSKELWYHGRISRTDAEKLLDHKGNQEGSFLVRDSLSTTGEYILSLCHSKSNYHYIISRHVDGTVAILDGSKFDSPVELVQYHTQQIDGLLTTLKVPCKRSPSQPPQGYRFITHDEMQKTMFKVAMLLGYQENQVTTALSSRRSAFEQLVGGILHHKQLWFHGAINREECEYRMKRYGMKDGLFLVRERTQVNSFALCLCHSGKVCHYLLDMNSMGQLSIENGRKFDNLIQVVDHYSRTPDGLLQSLGDMCPVNMFSPMESEVRHGPLRIDESEFFVLGKLGAGAFGTVSAGVYKPKNGGPKVDCAVKVLKPMDELPTQKAEILQEADAMASINHPNVIRLYGICVSDPLRLIMEIAPLGPLNKYLRKNQSTSPLKVMNMLVQISQGMEYLEQKQFVHRDLAGRNVLVVTENLVKISDFGMSKALGADSQYYKAETAGKWPLKWYAPECIWFHKFYSKSDVWSFGITSWEAFSYGTMPYSGMSSQATMDMVEKGKTLDCPDRCPMPVYNIMFKCWSWRQEDRPTFAELTVMLREIHNRMMKEEHNPAPPLPPKHYKH